jgi:hypothetical protein
VWVSTNKREKHVEAKTRGFFVVVDYAFRASGHSMWTSWANTLPRPSGVFELTRWAEVRNRKNALTDVKKVNLSEKAYYSN